MKSAITSSTIYDNDNVNTYVYDKLQSSIRFSHESGQV